MAHNAPPSLNTLLSLHLDLQRSLLLMVDFKKKGLDKKKAFIVRDEVSYFSEALGFSGSACLAY